MLNGRLLDTKKRSLWEERLSPYQKLTAAFANVRLWVKWGQCRRVLVALGKPWAQLGCPGVNYDVISLKAVDSYH